MQHEKKKKSNAKEIYDEQNIKFLHEDKIGIPEFSPCLRLHGALARHCCGPEDGSRKILEGLRTIGLTWMYDLKRVTVKGQSW